jgi:hypothetical protein
MPDISLRNADPRTRLATYLNDHLAGAVAGHGLAARAAASNRGNQYGAALAGIVREIEEDAESLKDLMDRLDVHADRVKLALGWAGEKVGRLKLNGQVLGYSPLSRLVELEGLMLGVSGKRALWQALRKVFGDEDPRLRGIDFEQLVERARTQRATLEQLRRKAAVEALS